MACKGTGKLMINEEAMDKLQALRTSLGRPMLITSAYRSEEHNAKVGGAKGSLHMEARAFDIRMDNFDPAEFEAAARKAGFSGFGYYAKQGFMHIDTGASRKWGAPFPVSKTDLPVENVIPKNRESVTQSTTVKASAIQIASGAGAGLTAVGALDGYAQVIALAFVGLVILAAVWILRERIKAWADGVR
jgi:hypothetical protein